MELPWNVEDCLKTPKETDRRQKKSNSGVMTTNYDVMMVWSYFQIFTGFAAVFRFEATHFFLYEKIISGYLLEGCL